MPGYTLRHAPQRHTLMSFPKIRHFLTCSSILSVLSCSILTHDSLGTLGLRSRYKICIKLWVSSLTAVVYCLVAVIQVHLAILLKMFINYSELSVSSTGTAVAVVGHPWESRFTGLNPNTYHKDPNVNRHEGISFFARVPSLQQ